MILLGLLAFLVAQIVVLFAFYRMVLRPLPGQINELLFKRQLKNDFTKTATDVADLLRVKLLELEAERLEAVAEYEALKGRRLNQTDTLKREALKKAEIRLTKQISGIYRRLSDLYAEPVLVHLRKFEQMRLVAAINLYIDRGLG